MSKAELENRLRDVIREYEELFSDDRSRCIQAQYLIGEYEQLFRRLDLAVCTHNAAIYGSKRYQRHKIKGVGRALSPREYAEITKRSVN